VSDLCLMRCTGTWYHISTVSYSHASTTPCNYQCDFS